MMSTLADSLPTSIRRKIEDGSLVVPDAPYEGQETAEEAQARAEEYRRLRVSWWQRRLPLRYADASVRDLTRDQDPRKVVSSWSGGTSRTLVLFSVRPGVGKTHAAYAVGNTAVAAGAWAEAWSTISLLRDLRPGGDPDALRRAVECDLLVLDDLGKEQDSEWTREQMHHIISERLGAGRRMVMTTNLTGAAMAERYSDPLVDRLADGATIVEVKGESRRKPEAW